jgi:hypothetical protein
LSWVESATLAAKSKACYCNGWRLLSMMKIVGMRLDHITKDDGGAHFQRLGIERQLDIGLSAIRRWACLKPGRIA